MQDRYHNSDPIRFHNIGANKYIIGFETILSFRQLWFLVSQFYFRLHKSSLIITCSCDAVCMTEYFEHHIAKMSLVYKLD
ncbi:hypothetical protein BDZ91DRAFT_735304 [Kalaharituber pfeilii]|nr:hypothetical protein BDZ91DRAFT_735304 [Kalaharituber pfeilii]